MDYNDRDVHRGTDGPSDPVVERAGPGRAIGREPASGRDPAAGPDPAAERRRAERDRAAEVLDLQEGRGSVELASVAEARALLGKAHRIAIVGASPDPDRPSYGVMAYLLAAGYDCVPINPSVAEVLGRPTFPDVVAATRATGRFDFVDVFRRPDAAAEVARQAVEAGAGALWLQLGVVSWEAAGIAAEAGLPVVMDRCAKIEHDAMRMRGG
jgi:predicted CoA-binding protein